MKTHTLLFTLITLSFFGKSQDTTYFSSFELMHQEYGNISPLTQDYTVFDYAIDIPRNSLKNLRVDSSSAVSTASDWITLYHAISVANPLVDNEDQTLEFSQELFHYWNIESTKNDRLTLPIGVIYEEACFIRDDAYFDDMYFSSSSSNYGWHLNTATNIEDVLEHHEYFSTAILYDETIFDQEIRFILPDKYLLTNGKTVDKVVVKYNNVSYELTKDNFLDLDLISGLNSLEFTTQFDDGAYITKTFSFEMDDTYFEDVFAKGSPFTGGKHTYISINTFLPDNHSLRYGIIWGACNNTGKLNKPVFMLHGFRPTVQPIFPSLKKLYNTKFNFKGASTYGSDGMVDLLVKNGYDVVICRIDPGFESIRRGGKLLTDFFRDVVEPQKESIGSKHENIVLGFSMGGHYWRHMLMLQEHEHLNLGVDEHHHTRIWIPFDTPLHGANNPLAHQFAAKSVAEKPAGPPSFNIAYNNMLTAGSQEQQRYDVNGSSGYDGATHRFHQKRVDYISELENDFYLGSSLTNHRGFPSATRNIAISVGSNSSDYYTNLNAGQHTLRIDNQFIGLFSTKKRDVRLRAARYLPSGSSTQPMVFKREVTRKVHFNSNTNVLVDDVFKLFDWYEWDNAYGSYLNAIRTNVNRAVQWNSLAFFPFPPEEKYTDDQVFVPTLSALAIDPRIWPTNMRLNLKDNGFMFNSFNLTNSGISNHYGYPHLGRPNDYHLLTPMNAYYCNENTYEHITLVKDANNQNDQFELITFLLNEIEPWYLDLQNQDLGQYARSDYTYKAKYVARERIRTGKEISPKTPFGDYRVLPNVDLELQSQHVVHIISGTHFKEGSKVHIYISPVEYDCSAQGLVQSDDDEAAQQFSEKSLAVKQRHTPEQNSFIVYPNPNSGDFNVKIGFPNFNSGVLEVYDLQGQLLESFNVKDSTSILLKNSYNSGSLLFARLRNEQGYLGVTKIIIK